MCINKSFDISSSESKSSTVDSIPLSIFPSFLPSFSFDSEMLFLNTGGLFSLISSIYQITYKLFYCFLSLDIASFTAVVVKKNISMNAAL